VLRARIVSDCCTGQDDRHVNPACSKDASNVTDDESVFAPLFQDGARVAVDRAAMELRAGRPIVVGGPEGGTVIAALDGIEPALYDAFSGSAVLVLSAPRAGVLGLAAEGPIAIPVAGLGRETACRLAAGRLTTSPAAWQQASPAGIAGIALCKQALLLPAVLASSADGDPLPSSVHRVRAADIHTVLERGCDPVEIASEAPVPIAGAADARVVVFRGGGASRDQVAIIVGNPDPDQPVLVRLHSACLTGDLFGSLRCDCGDQLRGAIACLHGEGGGILLYLDQEGRGIGLRNKMRAYALQEDGLDTIDADAILGFDADERRYDIAAAMLARLGYRRIRLLTNNPDKAEGLRRAGLDIVGRRPLLGPVTAHNQRYLATKSHRAGHLLDDVRRSEAS
jgi:GTP cyclohydrolase II